MMHKAYRGPKFSLRMWHWTMSDECLFTADRTHVAIFALFIEEASK